jgi:5'-AMP-activated protein kinase catalytic alpha subunit
VLKGISAYFVLDGCPYVFLVLSCRGEMFDFIVAQKHVSEVQACKFFHQIVDGVESLHLSEITHRDLKPEVCVSLLLLTFLFSRISCAVL